MSRFVVVTGAELVGMVGRNKAGFGSLSSAEEGARNMNTGDTAGHIWSPLEAESITYFEAVVVDTEDGWQPTPKPQRYIVVPIGEVPAGRVISPWKFKCDADDAAARVNERDLERGDLLWTQVRHSWARFAIVDTQDGFQPSTIKGERAESVAVDELKGLTDAEIVAAYEQYQREAGTAGAPGTSWSTVGCRDVLTMLQVGGDDGPWLPIAEVRAAWPRELKRRTEEKAKASRLPVRGDWADDHEGKAV